MAANAATTKGDSSKASGTGEAAKAEPSAELKAVQAAVKDFYKVVNDSEKKDTDKQEAAKQVIEEINAQTVTDDDKLVTKVIDEIVEADKNATGEDRVYFGLKKALNTIPDSQKTEKFFTNGEKVRNELSGKLRFFGFCGPEPDTFLGFPLLCGLLG